MLCSRKVYSKTLFFQFRDLMTQQDLSEFKCSDSEGDDADKSVKYVSFLVFFLNKFVFITVAMCRNTPVVSLSLALV